MRRRGYRVISVDLKFGAEHDLTIRRVQRRILQTLKSGRVRGVMLAVPCTSFSRARNRTRVIRSDEFPFGLPERDGWTENDLSALAAGNTLAIFTLAVLSECNRQKIPWSLENPYSSVLFKIPQIANLISCEPSSFIRSCMCAFGARWRKPTGVLVGNVCTSFASEVLCRHCKNKNGICDYSNKKHIILSGSAPGAVPWTRIAQAYPKDFSDALADTLAYENFNDPSLNHPK